MNLACQEALFAGTLGAAIGIVSNRENAAWWGDGTLADVVAPEVLAAACIGAVVGILAFVLLQKA
jgi:hypothetical protein